MAKLANIREAAEHLSISLRTLNKLIADRAIPHRALRTPGSRKAMIRFDLKELDDWANAQRR